MDRISVFQVSLLFASSALGFAPIIPASRVLLPRASGGGGADLGEEYSNPLTGIVGKFLETSPSPSPSSSSSSSFLEIDWDAPKARNLPVEELAARLDTGLSAREWFVTGAVLPQYFDDAFTFKDPDVTLSGIRPYAEGVRRLFDQETARAEVLRIGVNATAAPTPGASAVVTVDWRLSGRVNVGPLGLTLKPYVVHTDLHVSEESGLVVFQEDKFSVPGWDILLSALAPGLPFLAPPAPPAPPRQPKKASSSKMTRPPLDWLATALFKLETGRVEASSEADAQGRVGEPMAWAEAGSLANRVSEVMAGGPGYAFKQFVADRVAGDFDEAAAAAAVDAHVASSRVALFSFTTCPFCRKVKDELEARGIAYAAIELDEREDGNALRAVLGRKTKRTSVPSVFIDGAYIGGCNDGNPGLLPLAQSGELDRLLAKSP